MITYLLAFMAPVMGILLFSGEKKKPLLEYLCYCAFGLFCVLMIGFRYQVGGDWNEYVGFVREVRTLGLEFMAGKDWGYGALNYMLKNRALGSAWVNLWEGVIFVSGLFYFCKREPLLWLSLLIAVPYLVIVVAMGYSRQAMAIGCVMMAFSVWDMKRWVSYYLWIFVAILFHKAAVFMLLFGPLSELGRRVFIQHIFSRGKYVLFFYVLVVAGIIWFLSTKTYIRFYIDGYYSSKGALPRLGLGVLAAGLFWLKRDYFKTFKDYYLWLWVGVISIFLFGVSFFYSTLADRLGLFLIPFQMVVLGRWVFGISSPLRQRLAMWSIILMYGAMLYVWLFYAVHAYRWLPYRSILLELVMG